MKFGLALIGAGAGWLAGTCAIAQSLATPQGAPTPPPVETVRNQVEFTARSDVLTAQAPLPAPGEEEPLTPTNLQMLEDIAIYSMNEPKLRWSFSGDSAWSYDDYSGSQKSGYSTFSIGGGVSAEYGTPDALLDFIGQYAPGYDWSNGSNNASGVDQSFSFAGQWHPSEKVAMRVTVNLREAPGTDNAGNPAQIISAGADVNGAYALDPNVSIGFDLSIQPQYFSTYGNTDQDSLTAYSDLILDPALRLDWFAGGEIISAPGTSTEHDLQTGMRIGWTPTEKFGAAASLGPNFRFASGEAMVSPDVLSSMTWSPMERTSLTAQAYSQVQPGDGSKGGNPQTYGASITGSQLLMSSVLLSVSGGYELSTYPQGGASNETLDFVSIALNWHPHEKWSAGTFCRFERQSNRGGNNFTDTEFGVNFSLLP